MKKTLTALLAAIASLALAPAGAFDSNIPASGLPSAIDYASQVLPERAGVLSWQTLAKVEPVSDKGRMMPRFDAAVLALDRSDVRVQGFMIPLGLGERQQHFLISAVPPHCPFCMPAGPEAMIEVKAKSGIAYSIEPVVLSGKLLVMKDDPEGMLYRLVDASQIR